MYYNASRKLILRGVDGVVFVADSQADRAEANVEAMQNLYDNLAEHGYDGDILISSSAGGVSTSWPCATSTTRSCAPDGSSS